MEVILTTLASMFKPDERFIVHRYYSSRLALIVGVVMLGSLFIYERAVNQNIRMDLMIIMVVMAITKILAMAYFRLTH